MIVVSGASGQLGRRTVEYLLEGVDASRIVALSRTPGKAADLGVAVRPADFDDPDALVQAFDGAERLLLISTDNVDPAGVRIRQHTSAIEAAAKARVGQVLYTSMVNAGDPDHPVFVAADHRETERALGGSGLTFTMLRANIYTEVLLGSLVPAVAGGVYASNAGDGATAYVARDDLAAVAAGVLAEGGHEGERLDVTGPAAVTGTDIAAITSDVAGTPVRYQPISDAEAVAGLVAAGLPEAVAGSVSTFGRATREGWFDVVSDAVERVAGWKPTPIADVLSANRSMLVGG